MSAGRDSAEEFGRLVAAFLSRLAIASALNCSTWAFDLGASSTQRSKSFFDATSSPSSSRLAARTSKARTLFGLMRIACSQSSIVPARSN